MNFDSRGFLWGYCTVWCILAMDLQGRNWLPKTGWTKSNAARHYLAALSIHRNLGKQLLALPSHQLRPWLGRSLGDYRLAFLEGSKYLTVKTQTESHNIDGWNLSHSGLANLVCTSSGALGGKTGETSALPGFSKIEHGSGGAPYHYNGLT